MPTEWIITKKKTGLKGLHKNIKTGININKIELQKKKKKLTKSKSMLETSKTFKFSAGD